MEQRTDRLTAAYVDLAIKVVTAFGLNLPDLTEFDLNKAFASSTCVAWAVACGA